MIGVRLMGGLGNQMFQYALGRKISLQKNTTLSLDLNSYNNQHESDTPRHYELDCYKLNSKLIKKPISDAKPRFSLFSKATYFSNTYTEKQFPFNKEVFEQQSNTLYVGYWQTEKYFSDIRDQLINDFSPKNKLSDDDLKILESIKAKESVSLHVRRGDYVTNQNANKFHGLKGLDYYKKAIDIVKNKSHDFTLFIFSDDIEWCKTNLSTIHKDIVFVDGNRAGYIDMYLMKHCNHNIIANSSFSWWAAWLNENPTKQIVAPNNWFDDPSTDTSDIVPASWIRI